ncbi:MAG: right-handed parallel beta-helix repeat-containing protein, partial [Halobacteriales archaeon]
MPPSASVRSSALRAALIAGVVIAVVVALAGSTAAAPTTVVECRTLQEPGTYELAGDLLQEITGNLTTGSCLVIDSPNVTLLGNGHAVSGSGSASVGVEVRAHQNVTVSNLTVEGFDSVGVWATGTTGFEARNLSVNATGTGLKIEDGDAPTLTQVRVSNATGVGIAVFNTTNATASDILTRSNQGAGVGLRNTSDATVRGLDSRADGMGVNVTDSAQVTVRNATVRNPASQGIRAVASPDALLADNTVRGAGLAGILVRDAAARLERNVVREGIRGVVLDAANGSVSLNDTATGTLDGAGLFVDGARNVTVRGFNTTGNLVGVSVQNANTTRLDGVLAQQNDLEGIVVHASTATLTDVIARGNGVGGVRVVAGSAGSGSNLTVRQNPVGLWLQSSPDWVTEGVVAADNGGSGSAVRVTGAPGTVRGLELVNGTLDVGNRTLDLRARGIALGVDAPPPDAPAAHRYLGSALEVQNVSGGASAWLNASAAWSPAEVDAYQVEEPRWQRWNGTAWETVSGFNRAFPTDRRVVANATEFGVLAPLVRDDVTPPDATVRVNGTRGDNGWWITPPEVRVNATDAYAGVASRELRVDGNWISITDPVTLDEGVTVVRGRATDLAGLSELTDNRTVRVDIEPPRTNATAPTGWVNRTVNVTL